MATKKQINFYQELIRQERKGTVLAGRVNSVEEFAKLSVYDAWKVIHELLTGEGNGSVRIDEEYNNGMVNDYKKAKEDNFTVSYEEQKESFANGEEEDGEKEVWDDDLGPIKYKYADNHNKNKVRAEKQKEELEKYSKVFTKEDKDADFDLKKIVHQAVYEDVEPFTNDIEDALWVTPSGLMINAHYDENGIDGQKYLDLRNGVRIRLGRQFNHITAIDSSLTDEDVAKGKQWGQKQTEFFQTQFGNGAIRVKQEEGKTVQFWGSRLTEQSKKVLGKYKRAGWRLHDIEDEGEM